MNKQQAAKRGPKPMNGAATNRKQKMTSTEFQNIDQRSEGRTLVVQPENRRTTAKRGPKPLHGENMQAYHFRMTKAQREKLDALGGGAWLREKIKRATLSPTPSKDDV